MTIFCLAPKRKDVSSCVLFQDLISFVLELNVLVFNDILRICLSIVIDDEPLAIQILEDFVNKTPHLHLAGKFEEPLQALSVLESVKIDLLFLDIKMPDISGIDSYFFRKTQSL